MFIKYKYKCEKDIVVSLFIKMYTHIKIGIGSCLRPKQIRMPFYPLRLNYLFCQLRIVHFGLDVVIFELATIRNIYCSVKTKESGSVISLERKVKCGFENSFTTEQWNRMESWRKKTHSHKLNPKISRNFVQK